MNNVNNKNKICNREDSLISELINIWRKSTLDLNTLTIDNIKILESHIKKDLINIENLILVKDENNSIIAFMGIEDNDLKMIFVDPSYKKMGLGKELVSLAIEKHNVNKISVMSPYLPSLNFCSKLGFKIDDTIKNANDNSNFITHLKLTI